MQLLALRPSTGGTELHRPAGLPFPSAIIENMEGLVRHMDTHAIARPELERFLLLPADRCDHRDACVEHYLVQGAEPPNLSHGAWDREAGRRETVPRKSELIRANADAAPGELLGR